MRQGCSPTVDRRLPVALLLLRLGVFVVMIMWTLDNWWLPGSPLV